MLKEDNAEEVLQLQLDSWKLWKDRRWRESIAGAPTRGTEADGEDLEIQPFPEGGYSVGEIFTAAGAAFNKLGELIMTLNSVGESSPSSGKWTAQEMEMLKSSVKTFGTDLERINENVKSKSIVPVAAVKAVGIKRKSFEDPSVGIKKQMTTAPTIKTVVTQDKMRTLNAVITQATPKSADITLNMLNAMEPEVDVDGLTSTTKLEYDSSDAS